MSLEAGITSGSFSILSMLAYILYKKWRNKTKVYGLLTQTGKSYTEKNMNEVQNQIYIDIDGVLSVEPLRDVDLSKKRLELYPKAVQKLKELKTTYKNQNIILMSSDYDLLCFLGLKNKCMCVIPTKQFFESNFKDNPLRGDLEKQVLEWRLKIKRRVYEYNSYEGLNKCMKNCIKYINL